MRILRKAKLLLILVLLVSNWSLVHAQNEPPRILVVVSPIKGAPGAHVSIPIYISNITKLHAKSVEFDVLADSSVLRFEDVVTDDRTVFLFANSHLDEFTQPLREHFLFTSTVPFAFNEDIKPLVFLQYEVVGDKGSSGFLKVENFSFGEDVTATVAIANAEFRVLPTALYFDNYRSLIEITSSEVFTSFELDTSGEIDSSEYSIENVDSPWVVEQTETLITGHSRDPSNGATSVNVFTKPDEDVVIYSLRLNGGDKIQFVQRHQFIPFVSN